jgi:hypothetical protein
MTDLWFEANPWWLMVWAKEYLNITFFMAAAVFQSDWVVFNPTPSMVHCRGLFIRKL